MHLSANGTLALTVHRDTVRGNEIDKSQSGATGVNMADRANGNAQFALIASGAKPNRKPPRNSRSG